ncbi:hypothetical protein J1605_009223 [Eschrichtius robustus]|uniref:Uncharacterized protein n=1 Tax=Eschrichtius robustus TaxID=9764 RepID=A0AB34GVW2_ESCRO|nr:hypothetical protein J1605_009223 [Eschrichtius robustus]
MAAGAAAPWWVWVCDVAPGPQQAARPATQPTSRGQRALAAAGLPNRPPHPSPPPPTHWPQAQTQETAAGQDAQTIFVPDINYGHLQFLSTNGARKAKANAAPGDANLGDTHQLLEARGEDGPPPTAVPMHVSGQFWHKLGGYKAGQGRVRG